MIIRSNTSPRKVLFHSTSSSSSPSPPPSPSSMKVMKSKNKHAFVLNIVLFGCMMAYSTYKFGVSSATVHQDDSVIPTNNRNLLRSSSSSSLEHKLDRTLPKGTGYGHHVSLDLVIPPSEESSTLLINPTKLQTITREWCQHAHLEISAADEKIQFFPKSQGILFMTTFQNEDGFLTLQTYPTSSKIMIDLLVRGDPERSINLKTELLPLVVQTYGGDITKSIYSIKQRGIAEDPEDDKKSSMVTQFHPQEIMATHQFKSLVFETQSPYQHIAIYDHHDFAEESQDVVTTTRSLFLDGVMQSNVDDEAKYHETLVHPAMLTAHYSGDANTKHHEPKRVLIVGGGEGGTLRESLKYKSVETTTMVDLDKGVVDASRQYLPSYNNCTGFGAAPPQQGSELLNCFDDPRTELYTEDFIGWFEKHVGNDICDQRKDNSYEESKLYDVVILDLLDTEELPEDQEWAQHLYSDLFFQRLACVMSPQGVLVTQFGEGPAFDGGPVVSILTEEEDELNKMFAKKIKTIQTQANLFEHTKVYDNFIPAFRAPWAFAVSMIPNVLPSSTQEKDSLNAMATAALNNFHSSAAYINAKLKRVLRQGASTEYYDGPTQFSFQNPEADWLSYYCKDKDTKTICTAIEKFFKELKVEDYVTEEQDEGARSKWIAKQSIPKGHITILLPSKTQQERDINGILKKFDCSSDEGDIVNLMHASHAKPWSAKIWEDAWNPLYLATQEEFQHTYVATRDIQKGETIISKEWCLPQGKKTRKAVQPKQTDTAVV